MRWVHVAASAALALAALTPAAPAAAWGNSGHAIIARVAIQRLEARRPGITATIKALYAGDVLSETYTKDGQTQTCRVRSIDELAQWADCVRYAPAPSPLGLTRPDHFDDAPLRQPLDAATPNSWCDQGCATQAIPQYAAILQDASATRQDRARALAFLIHFVSDLHQPLHAVDNGDSGGNLVKFPNPNLPKPGQTLQPMSLHSYWDSYLVGQAVGEVAPGAALVAARANKAAPVPAGVPDATALRGWLIESHAVAVDAYKRLGLEKKTGKQTLPAPPSAAYRKTFKPQVIDRLTLAALRLEAVLDATIH